MTVADLIAQLQQFPQNADVCITLSTKRNFYVLPDPQFVIRDRNEFNIPTVPHEPYAVYAVKV